MAVSSLQPRRKLRRQTAHRNLRRRQTARLRRQTNRLGRLKLASLRRHKAAARPWRGTGAWLVDYSAHDNGDR